MQSILSFRMKSLEIVKVNILKSEGVHWKLKYNDKLLSGLKLWISDVREQ